MRLIDANTCPCNECNKFCDKNCCDEFVRWLKGCDYSINKVVEQLEEDSHMALYEMNEPGIYAGIQTAIEVVKEGSLR